MATLDGLLARTARDGDCRLWTGASSVSRSGKRYGQISHEGKVRGVHVVVCLLTGRDVPPGWTVHHRCERTLCCEPTHVEPRTFRANVLASDTPAARNARKTHCPKNHPYDEANTIWRPAKRGGRPRRLCRTCENARRARNR